MHEATPAAQRLHGLIESAIGAPLPLDDPEARAASLWELGISSAAFIRLLVEVEQAFGVSWELDSMIDGPWSYDRLLAHVEDRAGHGTVETLAGGAA